MQYGYFDDARREYVITTPRTPLPWINYLGSEAFFTLLSNTAGGYSFYKDARLRRITRYRYNASPLDGEGFRVYIRDGETVWNPGWQPVQTELDRYECRHGLGYSVIEGAKSGGTPNLDTVLKIKETSGAFCEIGGGVRSMEVIGSYLSAGIDRVILGTSAIADEELLKKALKVIAVACE